MIDYVCVFRLSMRMEQNELTLFAREALMNALDTAELKKIFHGEDFERAHLAGHILKYRAARRRKQASSHRLNYPIEEVLDDYINRRKGKLLEAKRQLRKRFDGLDHAMQTRVMLAFMEHGCAPERDFISEKLLGEDFWVDDFIPLVQQWWEASRDFGMARVVVKYCPREYLMSHIDELLFVDYATFCIRTGFFPNSERLTPWTYLYVLKTSGGQLGFREGERLVFKCIRQYLYEETPDEPPYCIYGIPHVRQMMAYLGEMGMEEDIRAIDAFELRMAKVAPPAWGPAVIKAIEETFPFYPYVPKRFGLSRSQDDDAADADVGIDYVAEDLGGDAVEDLGAEIGA